MIGVLPEIRNVLNYKKISFYGKALLLFSFFWTVAIASSAKNPVSKLNETINLDLSLNNKYFNLPADSCKDSLIIKLPTRSICAGDQFEIEASLKSNSDILWFRTFSDKVPFDTTSSGDSKSFVLDKSSQFYLEPLVEACKNIKLPLALLVNPNPEKPEVTAKFELCEDSLVNLNSLIISAPDDSFSNFKIFKDAESSVQVNGEVGEGVYYIIQESLFGCASEASTITVSKGNCDKTDLQILKTSSADSVKLGGQVQFALNISNSGTKSQNQLKVEDVLPSGLTLVSASGFEVSGDTLRWQIDTLNAGASINKNYIVKASQVGVIVNKAEILAINNENVLIPIKDEVTIIVSDTNSVPVVNLPKITKVGDKRTIIQGESIKYTLTVKNEGSTIISGIVVKDRLDAGLTLTSTSGNVDLIEVEGRIITATIDSLKKNEESKLIIEVKADSAGLIKNTAKIVSFSDFNNNMPIDTFSVNVLAKNCDLASPVISVKRTHINLGDTLTLTAIGCSDVVWSNGLKGKSIEIAPQTTTAYKAYCVEDDCIGPESNTLEISVVKVLKPTISASQTEICYGQEVTLTANGCDEEIRWSNGSMGRVIKVVPLVTTNYKVICEDSTLIEYQSDPITITVDTAKTGFVETKVFIQNSCPDDFVNLNKAVINYSKGHNLVFKNGVFPSSSDADSLIKKDGLYYAFVKDNKGCFSESAPITVSILECKTASDSLDVDVSLLFNDQKHHWAGDTLMLTVVVQNNTEDVISGIELISKVDKKLGVVSTSKPVSIRDDKFVWFIPELGVSKKDSLVFGLLLKEIGTSGFSSDLFVNRGDWIKTVEKKIIVSDALPCIATALQSDTTRLQDGTYYLDLTTYLTNCGNFDLTSVEAKLSLEDLNEAGLGLSPVGMISLNSGSTLNVNEDYNGVNDTDLLFVGSTLAIGQTDEIRIRFRVAPNGINDKFFLNTHVSGDAGNDNTVTDVSNAGNKIIPDLSTSTIVRFGPSPAILSTLVVKKIIEDGDNAEISFQSLIKNNTAKTLTDVIISDSLFKYFEGVEFFEVKNIKASGQLKADSDFTGKDSTLNLTMIGSSMPPGVVDTLEFDVILTGVNSDFYYNQLAVNAISGTDSIKTLSHWADDIEIEGTDPTEVYLPNVIIKDDACLGLSLAATNKVLRPDGNFDITYTAIISNCGTQEITNISICDNFKEGLSDSTEISLLTRPRVNSSSLLFLNQKFDGDTDRCFFNPELSHLQSSSADTLTYTIRVKPIQEKTLMKNLVVYGMVDSVQISATSSDGLNPYLNSLIPTIVVFDSTINQPYLGLAKNLEWVRNVDSLERVFEMEFSFVVKNYTSEPVLNLQISDDLWSVFGDSVRISDLNFSHIPSGWVINPLYGLSKGEINLLKDSSSQIGEFQSETIKFVVTVELISTEKKVFENFGLVIGNTLSGITLEDTSNDGVNPDSNGSGDPLDDSQTTIIDLSTVGSPEVTPFGVAKDGYAELMSSGSTKIFYTVYVKNYGEQDLANVQLTDNLNKVFEKNTQFILLDAPVVNSGSNLVVNSSYDGVIDTELLSIDSWLPSGVQDTLTFSVGVFNVDNVSQTYKNQILGSATYGGNEVADLSVSGNNPDADGDGDPGNDSGYTVNIVDPGIIDSSNVKVLISEGISPNGDGVNDEFIIKLDNGLPSGELGILEVVVYNRWGHPVYKSDNYILDSERGKGWKGNSNVGVILKEGSVLPVGTYYYSISSSEKWVFGGKKKIGYITLMR